MRKWINLTEMPISHWQASPDMEANEKEMISKFTGYSSEKPHWHASDKEAIHNPQHIERIKTAFARCPHDFKVFFWQSTNPDYDAFLEHGEVDDEWLRRIIGPDAQSIIDMRSPESIVILMTNNLSDEYPIRLTSPWIFAHRISHAFEGGSQRVSHYFFRFLQKVLTVGYGLEWPENYYMEQDYEQIYGKLMGEMLGTMQSARKGKLVQANEWAHETLAQYIITGRITMRPLPAHFDEGLDLTDDPRNRRRVERLVAAFPKFLEEYFDHMLLNAEGKVFVI